MVENNRRRSKMKSLKTPCSIAPAVLAVAVLISQASAQSDSPAVRYFEQGVRYVQADNLDLAAKAFRASVRSEPKFADAWLMLGATLLDLDYWEEAENCLLKAIELKPEFGTHPHVKQMLSVLGIPRTTAEESIGQSPEREIAVRADARRYFNLGVEFARRQDVEQATGAFLAAVRIDPNNAEAWVGLGLGLYDLGHRQLALNCLKRGLAMRPEIGENEAVKSVLTELGEIQPERRIQ
jgi:tetratricopeptide (TPR) repeat protein